MKKLLSLALVGSLATLLLTSCEWRMKSDEQKSNEVKQEVQSAMNRLNGNGNQNDPLKGSLESNYANQF